MIDLRIERLRRGMTLPQFADACGVPYRTASRAEKGEGSIRPDNAKKIADFLGVDILEVLGEDVAA